MIFLVLAKIERIRGHSSMNTQSTTIIFIRLLPPTTLLPRGETLFQPPSHQYSGKTQRLFINNPGIFKDFFACRIVSAANHQHPKLFKDFFACRIVLAANNQHPKSFKDFPACNSNQQQQPAAATSSSSSQQRQPAAATSNSNQQQRSATATSSSNQHSSYQQHLHNQRRPPLVLTTVPSRGNPGSSWPRISCPVAECNHRTVAHFCNFSTFLKYFFCDYFQFFGKT